MLFLQRCDLDSFFMAYIIYLLCYIAINFIIIDDDVWWYLFYLNIMMMIDIYNIDYFV